MLLDEIVKDYLKDVVVDTMKALKAELVPAKDRKRWYNLKEATALKGGNYNTVKSNPKLQPKGGKPDAFLHNRKVWSIQSVEEWILITDENRTRYLGSF
jgi:hypothetical protein